MVYFVIHQELGPKHPNILLCVSETKFRLQDMQQNSRLGEASKPISGQQPQTEKQIHEPISTQLTDDCGSFLCYT